MISRSQSAAQSSGRAKLALLPGNAQVRVVLVLIVTVIVALSTVVNLMQGDYTNLFLGLGVAGGVLYIGNLWRYSWFGAIFIGMLGFSIAPTSFWIPADFMCCGFAIGMSVTLVMRRTLGAPGPQMVDTFGLNARSMMPFLILYAVWLVLQGMFGEVSPVYAGQYSIKNTVKGYAEDLMPVATLLLLILLRYRLPSMNAIRQGVTPAMILAIVPLCIYRAYQISKGHYESDETTNYFGVLIPVINLFPNEFALRVACPVAAMWASAQIFSPWQKLSKLEWLSNGLLIFLALIGSLLSAGRAIPIVSLFGICGMAFLVGRYGLIFAATAAFLLFVAVANVAGPAIDQLPFAIRRSVAMVRFDQNADKDVISGSTAMRDFLIDEGIKEVKSQNRILLTGRGVLQFTAGDAAINQGDQEYDKWMLAVRTGRLHQTSANQVIRYGVIGAFFYYLLQFVILIYCYRSFKFLTRRKVADASVAAFGFGVMLMNTGLGFFQDGPLTNMTAWFVALVVGVVTHQGVPSVVNAENSAQAPLPRSNATPRIAVRR